MVHSNTLGKARFASAHSKTQRKIPDHRDNVLSCTCTRIGPCTINFVDRSRHTHVVSFSIEYLDGKLTCKFILRDFETDRIPCISFCLLSAEYSVGDTHASQRNRFGRKNMHHTLRLRYDVEYIYLEALQASCTACCVTCNNVMKWSYRLAVSKSLAIARRS